MANPICEIVNRFLTQPSLVAAFSVRVRRPWPQRCRSLVRIPVRSEEELPVAVKVRRGHSRPWRE